MRCKVLRITEQPSKQGGIFYYVFLKSEDEKSFKTCLYPNYRNFTTWQPIIALNKTREVWIDNVDTVEKNGETIVDADSKIVIEAEKLAELTPERMDQIEADYEAGKSAIQFCRALLEAKHG